MNLEFRIARTDSIKRKKNSQLNETQSIDSIQFVTAREKSKPNKENFEKQKRYFFNNVKN